jgi:hypothetical protein
MMTRVLCQLRVGLDRVEHLQAVHFARHHDVEHDQVGLLLAGDFEAGHAVLGFEDLEVLAQRDAYQATDVGMVIDEKYLVHFSLLPCGFLRFPALANDLSGEGSQRSKGTGLGRMGMPAGTLPRCSISSGRGR